jgi:hypothetical protein
MTDQSVFSTDWRDCLREQYLHVIRTGDVTTEQSLLAVLNTLGFRDTELAELRVRATMHVNVAPQDFVPNTETLSVFAVPATEIEIIDDDVPLEIVDLAPIMEPDNLDADDQTFDDEPGTDLEAEELASDEALAENDSDNPEQLSLF